MWVSIKFSGCLGKGNAAKLELLEEWIHDYQLSKINHHELKVQLEQLTR